ncbi:MAG: NAD-dependent epimerase/dehydratase family protein [Clostridia bacterium]|jgi:nucleoside-diphosphate-sugar epimerase|nr:NAD-dependent epimerase/dehydratase family protein [Clostridia bacterium]
MNVFMIGGTGLLGCEAAIQLIKKGHKVSSVALPPLPQGAPIPEEMELVFADINKKTDEEVEEMLKGKDCFIFAAGVDERAEFPAPVYDYYYKYNIAPLERIFPICKKVGVKRAVVLGSYFSYLAKQMPEKKFEEKCPYFRARLDQEKVCEEASDENFSAKVLELPYIFGTQPGRKPVWTILIEQIAGMDKLPFTMYPAGGTAMLTCRQVGEVICGAAEREVPGFEAFPIAMYNQTWKEFLAIVYEARGMGGRKIVSVPPWMMRMGMGKIVKDYKERGIDSGINPMVLPDIMDINLFIDRKYSEELGATEDDIKAAIFDSIKVSVASYEGKVELIDMKGE